MATPPPDKKSPCLRKILEAFKNDCVMLLHLFTNIKNGCYRDFVKLWCELGFSFALVAHGTFNKIQVFNAKTLEVGKELLLAKDIEYSRLGALYLLYLLFDRQFKRCENHILLTELEFNMYTEIIINLYRKGHEEVKFIHFKLEEVNGILIIYPLDTEEQKTSENSRWNYYDNDDKVTESLKDVIENNEFLTNLVETYTEQLIQVGSLSDKPEWSKQCKEACNNPHKTNVDDINKFLTLSKKEILKICRDNECANSELSNTRTSLKQKTMTIKNEPKHTVSMTCQGESSEQQKGNIGKRLCSKKNSLASATLEDSSCSKDEEFNDSDLSTRLEHFSMPDLSEIEVDNKQLLI